MDYLRALLCDEERKKYTKNISMQSLSKKNPNGIKRNRGDS